MPATCHRRINGQNSPTHHSTKPNTRREKNKAVTKTKSSKEERMSRQKMQISKENRRKKASDAHVDGFDGLDLAGAHNLGLRRPDLLLKPPEDTTRCDATRHGMIEREQKGIQGRRTFARACMCVYVCVRERERKRIRATHGQSYESEKQRTETQKQQTPGTPELLYLNREDQTIRTHALVLGLDLEGVSVRFEGDPSLSHCLVRASLSVVALEPPPVLLNGRL